MFYILLAASILSVPAMIFFSRKINERNLAAAEEMGKGIDVILPDGRRVVDTSIDFTIPHRLTRYYRTFPYMPTGQAEVIIFHRLKDGSWVEQTGVLLMGKRRGQSFKPVDEARVKSALSSEPEQFAAAFGEPVVVTSR